MEKILKLTLVFALFFAAQFAAAATKEELAALERQAKEKEQQLKQLQEQETKLERELKTLTQKELDAQRRAVELSADIEVFRTQAGRALEHKNLMEENLPLWQTVVQKELSDYIIEDILQSPRYGGSDAAGAAASAAVIRAHIAFLQKLSYEVDDTKSKLETFHEKSRQLTAKKTEAEAQRQNIQGDYQKKKTDLEDAHQRAAQAQKDLKDLKESAAQMQEILKAAEARRQAAAKKAGESAKRAAPNVKKNTLMWPVSGKIISKFGREYNNQLRTYIFRDGVKIAARRGTPVEAVKDGSVIYAGPFRSYGNVVILDHGGGFFTIYGFLSEIKAETGQDLSAGMVLGLSGSDTQGNATGSGADALYFEVRIGTTAEDPELWLE